MLIEIDIALHCKLQRFPHLKLGPPFFELSIIASSERTISTCQKIQKEMVALHMFHVATALSAAKPQMAQVL
jgi:hypothetical protein